jgi:hypothetical protein
MNRLIRSTALAALFLIAPAWVHGFAKADDPVMPKFEYSGAPIELPDSDTSSLGEETDPHDSPFALRCTDAATFSATVKRLEGKGMIVGEDMGDKTLVMVFKYKDGSINFARSNRNGSKVCIFGSIGEPTIDLGVVLGQEKQTNN